LRPETVSSASCTRIVAPLTSSTVPRYVGSPFMPMTYWCREYRPRIRHQGSFRSRGSHRSAIRKAADLRSEEHTSELQSLMRIPYAVFCFKKTHIHSSTPT